MTPIGRRHARDWGNSFEKLADALPVALYITEALIPDLRLELAPNGTRKALDISWPVLWTVWHSKHDPYPKQISPSLGLAVTGEPQYQARDRAWRMLAGGRLWRTRPKGFGKL